MLFSFKKTFLAAFAVVLLAAGCNQQVQVKLEPPAPAPIATTTPEVMPQQALPEPQPGVPNSAAISVTQTVEGSSINKPAEVVAKGESAEDILKADHKVEVKAYPGIGDFVTSIDGMAADSKHFWEFFVNGKSSNVGASTYIPKEGDVLEWKLSAIK